MSKPLPVLLLACYVFENLLDQYLRDAGVAEVQFFDYGLHLVPKKLNVVLQGALDAVAEPHLVVLGYGLCGNGTKDLRAGPHTLLIPRTDDCIAIFWGSYDKYRSQFDRQPGTYYLTKGWLESGSDPLHQHEQLLEKYDEKRAAWLMDQQYQHYKHLIFVAHTQADLDAYREQAQAVAAYCARWGMTYEEVLGTEQYVRELAAAAVQLSQTGGAADPGDAFIVVPPGGTLDQLKFLRGWDAAS